MTTQASNSRKRLIMTAVDIGTMGLCVAFTAAASRAGLVATGISYAVIMVPFIHAFSGVMNRHHPLPGIESDEMSGRFDKIGLQRTGEELKSIFGDAKRGKFLKAAIAAGVMSSVGLLSSAFFWGANEMNHRQEEFQKLPVLSGDTLIRVEELCALKQNIPFNKPFAHNGTQYRIICP